MATVSIQNKSVEVDHEVYEHWRRVGTDEGLTTDSQITTFLLRQYDNVKSGELPSPVCCSFCLGPLSLFCTRCQVRSRVPHSSCGIMTAFSNKTTQVNDSQVKTEGASTEHCASGRQFTSGTPEKGSDTILGRSREEHGTATEHGGNDGISESSVTDSAVNFPESRNILSHHRRITSDEHSDPDSRDSECVESVDVDLEKTKGQNTQEVRLSGGDPGDLTVTRELRSGVEIRVSPSITSADLAPKQEQLHACNLCHQRFSKPWLLKTHRMYHIGKRLFACKLCPRTFVQNKNLTEHMKSHTDERPFACELCDHRTKYKTALKSHMRTHTNEKPYVCSVCGSGFAQYASWRNHTMIHSGEKPYMCKVCPSAFRTSSKLKAHMRSHTKEKNPAETVQKKQSSAQKVEKETKEQVYMCEICGTALKNPDTLREHKKIHSDKRPFSCEHCPRTFISKRRLRAHLPIHSENRPYVCETCGYAAKFKEGLRVHKRTHTKEKPYACSVCESRFSQYSGLAVHMRRHTGERPYACPQCPQTFASAYHVKEHMSKHTKERPYSCDACNTAFKTTKQLRQHKLIHSDLPPQYMCRECGQMFKRVDYLRNHVKLHSSTRPYVCTECDRTFRRSDHLGRHMKTAHNV